MNEKKTKYEIYFRPFLKSFFTQKKLRINIEYAKLAIFAFLRLRKSEHLPYMKIQQFEDVYLSHFSYAIFDEQSKSIILIDPSRNPQPYLDFSKEVGGAISHVILTHSHADFVSCHLELSERLGAKILVGIHFPATFIHEDLKNRDSLSFDSFTLTALETPGHSLDSICILLTSNQGENILFSGDTLFIGDIGRPDLREDLQNISMQFLADKMYETIKHQLLPLDNNTLVYPTHGAGTLCGKALEKANSSTIGKEKHKNWALQEYDKQLFIATLTENQPFAPAYFSFDVEKNISGAPQFNYAVNSIDISIGVMAEIKPIITLVDTRDKIEFNKAHLPGSINIMNGTKFETWLGTIIYPHERFYLIAEDHASLTKLIARCAAIGYEQNVEKALIFVEGNESSPETEIQHFSTHTDNFTIVDVRNASEVNERKIFPSSIHIPLPELRKRWMEIPIDKPIMVHCAAGYRSAIASSLLRVELGDKATIFDLGEAIYSF